MRVPKPAREFMRAACHNAANFCAACSVDSRSRTDDAIRAMNTSVTPGIQAEGRLLFTLLDAADDAGRLRGVTNAHWREVKTRIVRGAPYEQEALALHDLLAEAEVTGALKGTWIEERWHAVESRLGVN